MGDREAAPACTIQRMRQLRQRMRRMKMAGSNVDAADVGGGAVAEATQVLGSVHVGGATLGVHSRVQLLQATKD